MIKQNIKSQKLNHQDLKNLVYAHWEKDVNYSLKKKKNKIYLA